MPRSIWACTFLAAALALAAAEARAQRRPVHYEHPPWLPPGQVATRQLSRGGPLGGYPQPVELDAPAGAVVSYVQGGQWSPPTAAPFKAGLLIGPVYQFRVGRVPGLEGEEVYPTVEVINRLYPPPGLEAKYPIPIQLTQHELESALRGQLVTRVIYLEDPREALPVADDPKRQRYFEVLPHENPLEVADALGRPMAILRMGSRVPDLAALGGHEPPVLPLPPAPPEPIAPGALAPGQQPPGQQPPPGQPVFPAPPQQGARFVTPSFPTAQRMPEYEGQPIPRQLSPEARRVLWDQNPYWQTPPAPQRAANRQPGGAPR